MSSPGAPQPQDQALRLTFEEPGNVARGSAKGTAVRIAIVGTRGIPANYGGYETFAQQLGERLADRGHDVTVIGRRRWVGASKVHRPGLRSRNVVSLRGKYPETVSAAVMSVSAVRGVDVVLQCNAATAFVIPWITRVHGVPVAINVDGLDWQRAKWGRAGRLWFRLGERLAARHANVVVADAKVIDEYYELVFPTAKRALITYGSALENRPNSDVLTHYGLVHRGYLLYVSRFEPENNPELVARAYLASSEARPLVMLGTATYDHRLGLRMARLATDQRLRLLGGVYGDSYQALQSSAYAYIHGTSVGGTHPALVEAMSVGNVVLALNTPENREVVGDAGLIFHDEGELIQQLSHLDDVSRDELSAAAADRALNVYGWTAVTDAYERLLINLTTASSGAHVPKTDAPQGREDK